jgi:hypothetical protein
LAPFPSSFRLQVCKNFSSFSRVLCVPTFQFFLI